jgi:hypothetical protein
MTTLMWRRPTGIWARQGRKGGIMRPVGAGEEAQKKIKRKSVVENVES